MVHPFRRSAFSPVHHTIVNTAGRLIATPLPLHPSLMQRSALRRRLSSSKPTHFIQEKRIRLETSPPQRLVDQIKAQFVKLICLVDFIRWFNDLRFRLVSTFRIFATPLIIRARVRELSLGRHFGYAAAGPIIRNVLPSDVLLKNREEDVAEPATLFAEEVAIGDTSRENRYRGHPVAAVSTTKRLHCQHVRRFGVFVGLCGLKRATVHHARRLRIKPRG